MSKPLLLLPVPNNPALPQQVEDVLLRALAKDAQQRFASIQQFADALEQACEQKAVAPRRQFKMPFAPAAGLPPDFFLPVLPTVPLPSPQPVAQGRNRQRLLQKVWTHWISGVLEQSLHGAALLTLGLQEQAQALEDPWQLVMQPTTSVTEQPHVLAAGTRISQVYDQAGGELLLELARELLERAKNDATHPVPVVFNLSSWALKRQPLVSWLIEELNTKYQVPRKLATQWVHEDRLLLLLDGLDEVEESHRESCVQAINAYRHKHGLVPIVVSSRNQDYLRLSKRLLLQAAVLIQPLSTQQVEQYLLSLGKPVESLRRALQQDIGLQELASTPLMLSILALTYSGKPVADLLTTPPEIRRQQVLSAYIDRMLQRGRKHLRTSPAQTMAWLSWLASQMQRHNQSEFYLEQLQPDWLPTKWLRVLYSFIVAGLPYGLLIWNMILLVNLAFIAVALLLNGQFYGSDALTIAATNVQKDILGAITGIIMVALIPASTIWILNGLLYKLDEDSGPRRGWWRYNPWRLGIRALWNGACITVLLLVLSRNLPSSFIIGVVLGFLIGLTDALFGDQGITITPSETLSWSWKKMLWNGVKFTFLGTCTIYAITDLFYVFGNLYYSWHILYEISRNTLGAGIAPQRFDLKSFETILLIAVFFGSFIGLLGGLLGGIVSREQMARQKRVKVNEGIKRSRRNGFLTGTSTGIAMGLLIGLPLFFLFSAVDISSTYILYIYFIPIGLGAFIGTFVGTLAGLRNGGYSWMKHSVLRFFLWVSKRLPWRAARFLDQAAQCILLRKVGGGYVFIHRLLLEHFASLSSARQMQHSAPRIVESSVFYSSLNTQPAVSPPQPLAALPASQDHPSLWWRKLRRRTFLAGAASLGVAGSSALWWLTSPHPRRIYPDGPTVLGLGWSPESTSLVSVHTDTNALCVWDALRGQRVTVLDDTFLDEKNISSLVSPVCWQPNGPHVAYIAGNQKSVHIWDTTTGQRTATCTLPAIKDSQKILLNEVVWAPEGQRIAAVGGNYIFLWDATTGKALLHRTYEPGAANSLAWSPGGQWIALAGEHVMQALHATTLQPLFKRTWTDTVSSSASPRSYTRSYGTVAWSPDSQYVATAGGQNDTV